MKLRYPTNIEELYAMKEVIILFESENCPTCHALKSKLNTIESDMEINIVNVYKFEEHARKFNIIGTPCSVKLIDGIEDDRMYGNRSDKAVHSFIRGE